MTWFREHELQQKVPVWNENLSSYLTKQNIVTRKAGMNEDQKKILYIKHVDR